MKKYPKIIFVQREEEETDASYLLAYDEANDASDGVIAIYELKEVKNKTTKTIIQ